MSRKQSPDPMTGRTGTGKTSGEAAAILRRLLASDTRLILASQLPTPSPPTCAGASSARRRGTPKGGQG